MNHVNMASPSNGELLFAVLDGTVGVERSRSGSGSGNGNGNAVVGNQSDLRDTIRSYGRSGQAKTDASAGADEGVGSGVVTPRQINRDSIAPSGIDNNEEGVYMRKPQDDQPQQQQQQNHSPLSPLRQANPYSPSTTVGSMYSPSRSNPIPTATP